MGTATLQQQIIRGEQNVRIWLVPAYSSPDSNMFCVTDGSTGVRFHRTGDDFELISLSRASDGFGEFHPTDNLSLCFELLGLGTESTQRAFDFVRLAIRRWQWANSMPLDELT